MQTPDIKQLPLPCRTQNPSQTCLLTCSCSSEQVRMPASSLLICFTVSYSLQQQRVKLQLFHNGSSIVDGAQVWYW